MFFGAGNYTLKINDTKMDYACFGKGKKPLIMIPGLSLKRVKGSALPLAFMYRCFVKDYRVYVFDRREEIPEGYTVKDIADDIAYAMEALHIGKADIFGVSQGGMIAQYLALEYPQLVNKLVLAVTLSRENETLRNVIGNWIRLTEEEDFNALVSDIMNNMYSEKYLKKYNIFLPVLSKVGKPKDPDRFIRLAKACVTCDTYESLEQIKCPVFVIGGKQDKIVTGEASEEIAEKLGCEIYMYEDLGHSAYEEAGDFNSRIIHFLEN